MKKLIPLLFLVVFTSLLVSCEDDDFSTTVEVDLSEYGNNLVVLAPFRPDYGDNEWFRFYLLLARSHDILNDSEDFERIKDATIDFLEEGEYQFSFSHWKNGIYITSEPTGIETGKSYQLQIHSPEFGKVTANTYVPNRVNILRAYVSDDSYYDPSEDIEKVEFTLEIQDEPNVENFYYLTTRVLVEIDSSSYQSYPEFTSNDLIFDEDDFSEEFLELEDLLNPQYDRVLTFQDVHFEGQQKSIKVYLRKNGLEGPVIDPETGTLVDPNRRVYFIVGAMSRDLYLYKRSAKSQSRISENPFAEPIRVYNNIEGGLGIFGGFVEDTIFVE